MGELNGWRVGDEAGLMDDDLIAWVEEGAQGEIESLTDADGDEDFLFGVVAQLKVFGQEIGDSPAQFEQAEVGRVTGPSALQCIDRGLSSAPRSGEVRFTDPERDDVGDALDEFEKSRMPDRGRPVTCCAIQRSGCDGETLIRILPFHQDAFEFISLEHKMGCCGRNTFDGGDGFRDKGCDFAQVCAFDEQEEVECAAGEEHGTDLGKLADSGGQAIETAFTFRLDFDFDDGLDPIEVEFVFVDDGLIAEDDFSLFVVIDFLAHFFGGDTEHASDIGSGGECVITEDFEQLIHGSALVERS